MFPPPPPWSVSNASFYSKRTHSTGREHILYAFIPWSVSNGSPAEVLPLALKEPVYVNICVCVYMNVVYMNICIYECLCVCVRKHCRWL